MTIAAIVTALAWLGRATDVHAASAHRIADDPGPPTRLPVASGFDDAVSTTTLNSPTSSTSSTSSNASFSSTSSMPSTPSTPSTPTISSNLPAQSAPPSAAPARASNAPRPARLDGPYVLAVVVNGEPTGLMAPFVRRRGRWFVRAGDLRALGLNSPELSTQDVTEVALDALRGIRYAYDAPTQTLELTVDDKWLAPYTLGAPAPAPIRATAGTGVVVNYDGYVQRDRFTRASVWSEFRGFWPGGTLRQTGVTEHSRWRRGYRRYDTWWQHDDPARLASWTAGDLITGSLSWTRSLRIAGMQWRRNFSLRPDLVTFPVPALRGSAVVPSSVDLYLDGVRRMGARVPPGPFVIQEAPGLTGDLQASVVTRDALGREQITTVPLYIDPRLLARGLSSFSVEAGWPREAYGIRSFSYRGDPVASIAARYGASDTVTVEAQLQAGRRLALGGVGALAALGHAGVAGVSVAASSGRGAGAQWSAGYQYLSRYLSVDARMVRAIGHYRDIASLDGTPVPRASDRVSLSLPLGRGSTASLAWFAQRMRRQPATRVLSASLTLPAGTRGMISLGGFRDFARRGVHGVFAMLSVLLGGNALGSASMTSQGGGTQTWAGASRTPDYQGGWGWQVLAGRAFSRHTAQGELQYLGRHGQISALVQRVGRETGTGIGVTGALVVMDHGVHATRHAYDAFALVSADGQAGVPVLRESVRVGRTDARGYYLVPDLSGYEATRIGIDPMHLPADLEVTTTERRIAPQSGSGVLVRFPVRRYRAALVTLVGSTGQPLRPGTAVRHVQSGFVTIVGYDGEVFVDDLGMRNTLEAHDGSQRCRASFEWSESPNGNIARIGPLECVAFGTLAERRPGRPRAPTIEAPS